MARALVPYAVALLAGVALGWWINGTRWESNYNQLERDHAVALAESNQRARLIEQGWAAALEEVSRDTEKQIASLETELDGAAVERDGLREELARRTRTASSSSATAGNCEAIRSTALLYSHLLDESQELAGRYAEEADRRRIAGLACERAYDSLRE